VPQASSEEGLGKTNLIRAKKTSSTGGPERIGGTNEARKRPISRENQKKRDKKGDRASPQKKNPAERRHHRQGTNEDEARTKKEGQKGPAKILKTGGESEKKNTEGKRDGERKKTLTSF